VTGGGQQYLVGWISRCRYRVAERSPEVSERDVAAAAAAVVVVVVIVIVVAGERQGCWVPIFAVAVSVSVAAAAAVIVVR